MKKYFNGQKYDTGDARCIGWMEWCNPGDLYYEAETLYRRKEGDYFLYGEGGPASKYATRIDYNTTGWGEAIIPLTGKEAREWAEQHLDGDDYEKEFGTSLMTFKEAFEGRNETEDLGII